MVKTVAKPFVSIMPFDGTPTANYGWIKPDVGASLDLWGDMLNADLDGIDAKVWGLIGAEALTVTAPNTLSSLSRTADGRVFVLFVEGRPFFSIVSTPAFSFSGTTVTWLSTVYSLVPGNEVVALYTSS